MSLHLIESRAPSRVMVLRRPGANMVSVGTHAVLITLAILTTRTTPGFATKPPIEHVVYTAPVPAPQPPATAPSTASAPSSSSQAPIVDVVTPALVPPIEIPVVIPDVGVAPVHDMDAITIVRRSGGPGNGVPGGNPYGSGSASDVRDELHVDRAVMLLPGMPLPRYPESLRSAGIEDTLMASFVVDTIGRLEPGSLKFAGSPHVSFASAVRDALLHARFRPAEADGHKVRQLVQQPFVFTLSR